MLQPGFEIRAWGENLIKTLALYTTIYPGVEAYLKDWYQSLLKQTDRDYKLWIGLDMIEVEAVKDAMGGSPEATWVISAPGDTPALVRQRAFSRIVQSCDGVVVVDSDDILHETRVAGARVALETSDISACALRLVDQRGEDLGLTFGLPPQVRPEDTLPRNNIFGLSNSCFRSETLRRCLPIPASVALVDWYIATRAWLHGAKMNFDDTARMDYRQHDNNMARVRSPFSREQVIQDTERVRSHFRILRESAGGAYDPLRLAELERVSNDVETFHQQIVIQPDRLEIYVHDLNELNLAPLWWSCVANPALAYMWTH